jgi:hypothetical protein
MNEEEIEIISLICALTSMVTGIMLCSIDIFKLGTFLILTGGLTSMAIVIGDPVVKIWKYKYENKIKN